MESPAIRVAPANVFPALGASVLLLRERLQELLKFREAGMSFGNAHRDGQGHDVGVLVVLAASKLNREYVGLAERHEHKLAIAGAEHRPRVERINEPRPGDSGELQSIFDGAVNERFQIDRFCDPALHVRFAEKGFVVGRISPVGADVGERFDDFEDAALQVAGGELGPL